jgi:hypothetical protein
MEQTLSIAARGLELLCGLSLIVQTCEFLRLREPLGERGVWAWPIQRNDPAYGPAAIRRFFSFISRDGVHRWHLILRLPAAAAMMLSGSSLALALFLFAGNLLLLIRWRGAFNGGSDAMTMVVLTGLLLAGGLGALGQAAAGWHAALIYVALHAVSSYFVSGWIKLLNPDWRSGRALPLFLDDGIYGPPPPASPLRRPLVAKLGSWGFILWECAAPIALLDTRLALGFCAIGLAFHGLVFWYFGLNRFVFAWAATYPAIVYLATVLSGLVAGGGVGRAL